MTPCELWAPVFQSLPSTTLPWYRWRSPFCIDAPSSRWYWSRRRHILGEFVPSYTVENSLESSCRHVDHFCPSRPGVTPGLQDHSYTSVWCNTRPPGPPLPPSGELVPNNTPLGIPWNCAANSWNSAGPLSWYNTRTRGPPSWSPPWNPADSRRLAWWNQASRILSPSRLQWETIFVPSGI